MTTISSDSIRQLYDELRRLLGPQGAWWPADSPLELMISAILVQNTNWRNVEYALANLRELTNFKADELLALDTDRLMTAIRPSGFYQNKARAIEQLIVWLAQYDFDYSAIRQSQPFDELRTTLLNQRGIGDETADVFLLYVFDYPVFIADTYARRLFQQHGMTQANNYKELQKQLVLPSNFTALQAKELHGLIVEYGKLKVKPVLNWPS